MIEYPFQIETSNTCARELLIPDGYPNGHPKYGNFKRTWTKGIEQDIVIWSFDTLAGLANFRHDYPPDNRLGVHGK